MNNRIYKGHFIRKRYGQNFLNDTYIIERIVTAIHPKPGEVMVEIGPGLGALTEKIGKNLNTLTAIELDRDLVARLRMNVSLSQKLVIYQQDVMTFDFFSLASEKGFPLRIFGNLPYNISTPLMFRLFRYINVIKDMHFMMQKEVVNRLCAKLNSKVYGRLSVMAQYHFHMTPILEVPPRSFIPEPKVDSAVVRLMPRTIPPNFVSDIQILNRITTEAFGKRRKKLHNSLGHLFNHKIMEKLGINSHLRAENLTVFQYCQLANWLRDHHELKES